MIQPPRSAAVCASSTSASLGGEGYNTGISTYIRVLTNRKEKHCQGKVQLIDSRNFWAPMKNKSLGNKRRKNGDPHDNGRVQFGGCRQTQWPANKRLNWPSRPTSRKSSPPRRAGRPETLASGTNSSHFTKQICTFLADTQPKLWQQMQALHGDPLPAMLIDALVKEFALKGTLHVLRQGFKFYGKTFRLAYFKPAYFKPAHGVSPDVIELYQENRLTVTRQVFCHGTGNRTVDMALALNGAPLATIELKIPQTGQSWRLAIKQYQNDRQPGAPLFQFKSPALVRLAADQFVTKYMADPTFKSTALSLLARAIFDSVQHRPAGPRSQQSPARRHYAGGRTRGAIYGGCSRREIVGYASDSTQSALT